MLILGIESSCDETAVALVRDGREIVASLVASQIELHAPYGGVVPEVACRAHAETLLPLVGELTRQSGVSLKEVDVIAATARPGLIGALLVGLTAGKTLAWTLGKPFVGVDHIEGHIHAPRMSHADMPFPHLSLVVSGGHTAIYQSESTTENKLIAQTADDAAGECFDKVAALLGLGYPGGPRIEASAKGGNPKAVTFSRGKPGDDGMALSFSGLKTAVLYHLREKGIATKAGRPKIESGIHPQSHTKKHKENAELSGNSNRDAQDKQDGSISVHPCSSVVPDAPESVKSAQSADKTELSDITSSFQEAAVDMLIRAALNACRATAINALGLTGGVAANTRLREKLTSEAKKAGVCVFIAPRELCTDNAAMIAGCAYGYAKAGRFDSLDLDAVPN